MLFEATLFSSPTWVLRTRIIWNRFHFVTCFCLLVLNVSKITNSMEAVYQTSLVCNVTNIREFSTVFCEVDSVNNMK